MPILMHAHNSPGGRIGKARKTSQHESHIRSHYHRELPCGQPKFVSQSIGMTAVDLLTTTRTAGHASSQTGMPQARTSPTSRR